MPAPRTAPPRPAPSTPPERGARAGTLQKRGTPLPQTCLPLPAPEGLMAQEGAHSLWHSLHGTGLGTGGCRLWNITSDSNGPCRRSRPALTAGLMGHPVFILKPTDGNSCCGTVSLAQEGTAAVPPSLPWQAGYPNSSKGLPPSLLTHSQSGRVPAQSPSRGLFPANCFPALVMPGLQLRQISL